LSRVALVIYTGMAAMIVALILLIAGVLSPTWYWFTLWLVAATQTVVLLGEAKILMTALEEVTTAMATAVMRAVRCTNCRVAAMLMNPPSVGAEGLEVVELPPGWRIIDGQPYCDVCTTQDHVG